MVVDQALPRASRKMGCCQIWLLSIPKKGFEECPLPSRQGKRSNIRAGSPTSTQVPLRSNCQTSIAPNAMIRYSPLISRVGYLSWSRGSSFLRTALRSRTRWGVKSPSNFHKVGKWKCSKLCKCSYSSNFRNPKVVPQGPFPRPLTLGLADVHRVFCQPTHLRPLLLRLPWTRKPGPLSRKTRHLRWG